MGVLGGTRLAAHLITGNVGSTAGAACHCHAHALGNGCIVAGIDAGLVALNALLEHAHTIDEANNMRCDIVATVGDGCGQVGYL